MAVKRNIETAACGCGASDEADDRKALGVDPDVKAANLARLKRIEGQVRGVQRMVESDRYCADILSQIGAIQEALRGVGRELLRNHLRYCVAHATRTGGEDAEAAYDELVDLMFKNAR